MSESSGLGNKPDDVKDEATDLKKEKLGVPSVLNVNNVGEGGLSAYDRWELPAMDSGEDKNANNVFIANSRTAAIVVEEEEEEIIPLTAEEVEAIRQAAYDDGLLQGIEDGKTQGYEEGYKSGADDVRAMVTKMSHICRALLEPIPKQDDEIEQVLMTLVKSICKRVVQRELQLDSMSLQSVLAEALDCLHAGAGRIRIHLNPDDAEFIQKTLAEMTDIDFTWQLLPHSTISPGGCIVETEKSMVDARSEKRLAAVIEQVYNKKNDALQEAAETSNSGLGQLLGEIDHFDVEPSDDEGES
ncbi:MAG: flagellar assembly protein FliH [Pseudomonadales bacterium]|nr:flagellar assembly protein FliH [Pseudomonadales bacterium]